MADFAFLAIIIFLILASIAGFIFLNRKLRVDQKQTEAIRDLERRLTDFMTGQLKEIRGTVDDTSRAMYHQISSFTKETVQIREELKQVQEAMKDISSFQEIFRSPKLRGQWGEANLEYILSEYFPKEFYQRQYLFSSGEQVDAVLKLPNGQLLPIDAKFSSDNFEKMIEEKSTNKKIYYQKKFVQDVKANIDKISSKYILPPEKTVDYALMYIPAEAIFHSIMFDLREENIGEYARKKKVILTSPNTIYLTLRAIEHWFKDTQISRQTHEILKRLSRIQQDSCKLLESFRKLGNHLRDAISAYDKSEKRLSLFGERVEQLTKLKPLSLPEERKEDQPKKNKNYVSSN
jgi:DNA recombination protein RmuC